MNDQEIIEGNKLIAEFMGMGEKFLPMDYEHENGVRYHSSWDWLMPVVEKIEKENPKAGIQIDGKKCSVFLPKYLVMDFSGDTKLEATWNAVIYFIRKIQSKS